MNPSIFALSGLINAIFSLSFGVFIVYKNWRNKISRLFFLMTIAITIWSLGYWQWLSSDNADSALFWARVLSIGSIFIPVFYFHWITIFLDREKEKKRLIKLIYFASFIFLAFSFSDLFVKNVRSNFFFSFWPTPGVLYSFYLAVIYIGLIAYSIFLLLKKYLSNPDDKQKGQIIYALLGVLFGFGGGLTNFFLWYNIPIPPYGNFLVFLFPFFFGYSIIRYGMFNLKVIATEILTFAIWVAVFIATITAPTTERIIFDGFLLVFSIFFGILLIRSVTNEVRQRERLEKITVELEAANERLRQLDEAKSEFLSIASHQLRTPLTSIKGILSMLMEGFWGPLNDEQKKYLSQVSQSGERLLHLIEDLLNISRIEAGRMQFDFQPINLMEIVEDEVKNLEPQALEKKLYLEFEKPTEPLPKVKADSLKIRQVIQNLIDNSIKYTEKGGSKITLKQENGQIVFSITDTGIGLPKGQHLFEKFQRGQKATNQHTEGVGLGLYLADKLIKAHNGKIWAESKGEKSGSVFYFTIPIA